MYENGTVGLGYRCMGPNTTYYWNTPPYVGVSLGGGKYMWYTWYKKCDSY